MTPRRSASLPPPAATTVVLCTHPLTRPLVLRPALDVGDPVVGVEQLVPAQRALVLSQLLDLLRPRAHVRHSLEHAVHAVLRNTRGTAGTHTADVLASYSGAVSIRRTADMHTGPSARHNPLAMCRWTCVPVVAWRGRACPSTPSHA